MHTCWSVNSVSISASAAAASADKASLRMIGLPRSMQGAIAAAAWSRSAVVVDCAIVSNGSDVPGSRPIFVGFTRRFAVAFGADVWHEAVPCVRLLA